MIARLRLIGRAAAMLATLLIYLILHGSWRLIGARSPWPPRFLGAIARVVGVRVTIVGTPVARDVLYLANHQSWIDILAIAGASGSAFVAKGGLRDAPLVGWLCTLNHTLFVDRGDRLGVARQIDTLRQALSADHPVTVFPEGTTSDGTTLLPFKAALLGAIDPPPSGLQVQPLWLDYGAVRDVLWVGDEPGTANAARVLARAGTIKLTIHFLEAFDPAGLGRKAVANRARTAIEAAMASRD